MYDPPEEVADVDIVDPNDQIEAMTPIDSPHTPVRLADPLARL